MKKILLHFKKWEIKVLVLLILLYTISMSHYSILRHNAFFSGFDLANMDQTIWNTLHGNFFELSRRDTTFSRFSIHADLILVLLAPLYVLWDNVRMLLIAQSFILALGAIPTFLLAQKILKSKFLSLSMALVYLLNPWMQWINMYDFHGVAPAITFRLFAFYFAYVKQWKSFALFVFLSLISKESVALNIAILGLIIGFVFKEKKIGLATFFVSVIWFLGMVFLVIPYFSQGLSQQQHWAFKWYQFSSETEEISTAVQLPTPKIIFERFFLASDALPYYFNLLKPFAFLPLLGFPWLILALPTLTINMLSSHAQMRGVMLHYNSGIISALVISTIFGIQYLHTFFTKFRHLTKYSQKVLVVTVVFLLFIALRVSWRNSPLPYNANCYCIMYQVTDAEKEFERILQALPPDASITSSPEIRPHVTHRENAFTLPNATNSAEYIAVIDQNRLVGDIRPKEFENKLITQLNDGEAYQLIEHVDHFYLFQRK